MKTFIRSLALLFIAIPVVAQTNWNVDKSHSNVKFSVAHMVVSEVDGSFKMYNGSVKAKDDTFADAQVEFTIDVASINTDNERRDNHLKSDDFFNAEKFPQMKFVSKSFKSNGQGKFTLTGDLTIRDVTKPVTWDVSFGGTAKAGKDEVKAGFKASTTIDRLEYGLKWNRLMEAGGAVVSKEVKIMVNLELNKAKS